MIRDTVDGISIDKTAAALELAHSTVFHMRHKILYCVEQVILCDGSKQYAVVEEKCTVAHSNRANKANGFHSYIKERLLVARGVATVYLNRYNALFSQVIGKQDSVADKIYALMTTRNGSFTDISSVKALS